MPGVKGDMAGGGEQGRSRGGLVARGRRGNGAEARRRGLQRLCVCSLKVLQRFSYHELSLHGSGYSSIAPLYMDSLFGSEYV